MIGKKELVIDATDFIKGMSSGADINDGGYSNETEAVNITAVPGVLYAPAAAVDRSTNLTGEAIAYTPGISGTPGNGFMLSNNGKVISIDSTQLLASSSAAAGTFTTGKSDIAQFQNNVYATSDNDVIKVNTDLTGVNSTFWTGTLGKTALTAGVPHPLLEFIGYLWIGDLNSLNRIESTAVGVNDQLVLPLANTITALGIDSSTASMLIGATQETGFGNYSNTLSTKSTLFVYDGVSAVPSREIPVDGLITAIKNLGGITYITYGQKLGYWNGNGITFLRKLKNTTLSGANLAYKNHVTNIENTLYVVDGSQVLAYGEVLPGQKVFYYCFKNNVSSNNFSLICPAGNGNLGMAFATSKFYIFDTTSVATTNTMTFYTHKYAFPRPVFIRGFYMEWADGRVANDNNMSLYYKTQAQNIGFIFLQDTSSNFSILKNTSTGTIYEMTPTSKITSEKVKMLQLRYITDTVNTGLRRIVVYYDIAE